MSDRALADHDRGARVARARIALGAWIGLLLAGAPHSAPAVEMDLMDPTQPPRGAASAARAAAGEPVGAAGAVLLESVFLRGERRFAVIGGRRVEVGDSIGAVGGVGGATVLAIDLWGVRLRDASGDWVLKLTGDLIPVGLGNEQ